MSVFTHDDPMRGGYVYIMTNAVSGTLYIGVTADLATRVHLHRIGEGSDFCREHRLNRLVYVEAHDRINEAIAREKALKRWNRAWKLNLIEKANPGWRDLYEEIIAWPGETWAPACAGATVSVRSSAPWPTSRPEAGRSSP